MGNDACSSEPPDPRGGCLVCRGLGPIAVWLQCYGHPEPPVHACDLCGRRGVLVRVVAAGSAPVPRRAASRFGIRGRGAARRIAAGAALLALAAAPLVWRVAATDAATEPDAGAEGVAGATRADDGRVPDVTIELLAEQIDGERIAVGGTTSLPDGARIMYVVTDEAWRSGAGAVDGAARGVLQGDFVALDGRFLGELDVSGFAAGRLEVYVAFVSMAGGGQPDHVSALFGAHGERIRGPGYTADGGVPRVAQRVSLWR